MSVICQLRFHPILKVNENISTFQERVRASFPAFSRNTASVLNVQTPAGGFEVQHEQQFLFRKADSSSTMTLTTGSLAIENHRHLNRDGLFADVLMATQALQDTWAPVSPVRLGLRYVNIFDRAKIASELGREVTWSEVVTDKFLALPNGLASLDDIAFVSEVRGPVTGSEGAMTLRYGLIAEPDGSKKFRFDMDRYLDGSFDLDSIEKKLEQFGTELFGLFREAGGPALEEWMEPQDVGRENA